MTVQASFGGELHHGSVRHGEAQLGPFFRRSRGPRVLHVHAELGKERSIESDRGHACPEPPGLQSRRLLLRPGVGDGSEEQNSSDGGNSFHSKVRVRGDCRQR